MPHELTDLDRQMRDVLIQLAACSHVPAAGWGPTGRSPSTDEPPGGTRPPGDRGADVYAELYGPPLRPRTDRLSTAAFQVGLDIGVGYQADNPADKQRVLNAAQAELKHLRGHGRDQTDLPAGETREQRDERIVRELAGLPAIEAAYRARCGIRDVYRARKAAGQHPEDGTEIPDQVGRRRAATGRITTSDPDGTLAAEAHRMHSDGMSQRQIAMRLGVSRDTVARYLGKRAA